MRRKERIYLEVEKHSRDESTSGITASEIAAELRLDRGNVSRDLNALFKLGMIVKIPGRPVRFLDKKVFDKCNVGVRNEVEDEAFRHIIGQDQSLKTVVMRAKAAVLYPPKGLNTLITGPTGTGKTTFARAMYEYAMEKEVLDPKANFVVFNCAEYAENPQLLISQIFGHTRNAFTGAQREKRGLVEEADGGILFLDEVHRLPAEGQEMLFTLMDTGRFRRLGETETTREAKVLIIGATTESLEESLLKTFLRRMPVILTLPSLRERPMIERMQFIESFLYHEYKNMGVSMKIHKDVIWALLLYKCPGNIGQLKTDIQMICARAFLDYKNKKEDIVNLDCSSLPADMQVSPAYTAEKDSSLLHFIRRFEEDYILYLRQQNSTMSGEDDEGEQKFDALSRNYQIYRKFLQKDDGEEELRIYLNSISDFSGEEHINKEAVLKYVSEEVYNVVEESLSFVEMTMGRRLSDRARVGLIMHVNSIYNGLKKDVKIQENNLRKIIEIHPREVKLARLIIKLIEAELKVKIGEEEIGFITMFLTTEYEEESVKNIGVVIVAHGQSTAKSIADTANQILNVTHCRGIDMKLDDSVETMYKRTLETVQEADEGKGVLLLFDMGSLRSFAERIHKETSIKIVSVGMVSTLMAIEATRAAMMKNTRLEEMAGELARMNPEILDSHLGLDIYQKEERNMIAVTCMSGSGAAIKIGNIIKEITKINDEDHVEFRYLNNDGKDKNGRALTKEERKALIAVVGTVDLGFPSIPFISIDKLITGDGVNEINSIIHGNKGRTEEKIKTERLDQTILTNTLKNLLNFIDAEKVVKPVMKSLSYIRENLGFEMTNDLVIRYVIHVSCMIERILLNEILPYQNLEKFMAEQQFAFETIKEGVSGIEKMFHIQIHNTEIAYIVEMVMG